MGYWSQRADKRISNLCQVNQESVLVKDKVGRPQVSFKQIRGMWYFSHWSCDTVGWVMWRYPACKNSCWFVDGDDPTAALHVLYLQLSPPLPSFFSPIKSGMETFWYGFIRCCPGKCPLNECCRREPQVTLEQSRRCCQRHLKTELLL